MPACISSIHGRPRVPPRIPATIHMHIQQIQPRPRTRKRWRPRPLRQLQGIPAAAPPIDIGAGLRARRRSASERGGPDPRPDAEPRARARAALAARATAPADAEDVGPAEESRAFWRLLRGALEAAPSPQPPSTPSLPAPATAAAAAGSGGGFWANVRALAIITAGPAAAAALQFGLPYHSVRNPVARSLLFAFAGSIGGAANSSVVFSVLLRRPPRRIAPSYVPLFVVCAPVLFAATNAAIDLSGVPFGYVFCLFYLVLTNQICARLHARLFARRSAPVYSEAGLAGELRPGPGPEAGPADPGRAVATFGKLQSVTGPARPAAVPGHARACAVNMLIMFVLYVYLFLFSVARASVAQVQSVAVYLVSLASDIVFLLVPVSLLARRVARPFARRVVAWLRRLSAPAAPSAASSAPSSSDGRAPPDPSSKDVDVDLAPDPDPDPDGNASRVEVRPLEGGMPRPSEAEEGEGGYRGDGGDAGEDLWVYNVQTGIRSMILWQAVVSWVAAAVFVAAVAVARWGPGAASFPYSPATFDDAACASALTFSLLTAGANGAVVAALHVAALLFPRLKDRFAFTSSWRFLRDNAGLLGMTFMVCTSISFLGIYRQANIYFYLFPESFPP
eukprot:tig00021434_g21338.t1